MTTQKTNPRRSVGKTNKPKPKLRPAPQPRLEKLPDVARRRETKSEKPKSETVLLTVLGMSPAVLTETVWVLAREKPPVIPHRVVVVTTLPGKARLEDELFTTLPEYGGRAVWDALRHAVLGHNAPHDSRLILDDLRIIARPDAKLGRAFPLQDIRTPADNEVAANFLLDEVRRITENTDTTLVASLAGGRKTMGALLYACLSLLGRPQDRLTHVLVSEPFEDAGLQPRFYFPMQPETLHQHPRTGGAHSSAAARLWLADVPFVRLRELFPRQLGHYPGAFSSLVRAYATHIQRLGSPPRVLLAADRPVIVVNDQPVPVAAREYALYAYLIDRLRRGAPTNVIQKDCLDDLVSWLANWSGGFGPFDFRHDAVCQWKSPIEEDVRRLLSSLRAKFRNAGLPHLLGHLLPVKGRFGITAQAQTD